jgi:uncharacterized protein
MTAFDRRQFIRRGGAAAAGALFAGPLLALNERVASGAESIAGEGYGPLVDMGELALPAGFQYRVVSREGERMTDGNPEPSTHDGMAAFAGPAGTVVLARNHENKSQPGEIPVVVPERWRYDPDPTQNAGVTALLVRPDGTLLARAAVLGGTSFNCSGGPTPWHSWLSCEETFHDAGKRHGYVFEVAPNTVGPVAPEPIRAAGRFVHEAVGYLDGVLYLTEDQFDAGFYRYLPDPVPRRGGDLARSTGPLQALRIIDMPGVFTGFGFPQGVPFAVDWVTIEEPDPDSDTVRAQGRAQGAAIFSRCEGCWVEGGKVFFDSTNGGNAINGQIWQYDPVAGTLTLIFESPGADVLKRPDNLTGHRPTGDIFMCEDARYPQFIRGLTPDGQLYDFARAIAYDSEFAGACFDPEFRTLFVNQQGSVARGLPGRTYAIWGPWNRT